MAAVLVVSRFVVRRRLAVWNLVAWLVGTLTCHFAGASPIGPTLTSLLVAGILALVPLAKKTVREESEVIVFSRTRIPDRPRG